MATIDSHLSSDEETKNREAEPTGSPHDALFFVLAYLPVYELLVMSQVCVSLREALKNDVLPWQNICVERPLNSRLSIEGLLEIASRANGRLKSLSLVNCGKITDDELQRIVDENPIIRKLHVPGCTGLTPEGIIRAVKTLSQHHGNLESIQINGLFGVEKEHLETLCSYLQPYSANQQKQPIFYHQYRSFQTSRNKEGRRIDVEVCPICSQVRMVFSCSRETCEKKIDCRGCNFCILRCAECGVCVGEIGETICADIVCLNCWLHLPKCNFCNEPYCNQHLSPCSSTGFVCDVCDMKAVKFINDVSD
ncbi:hypothetical protein K2173_010116 [Erythroxylum novogranatense]|uniref:F-box domain-containing protein n=1 Tax=Erythroxylum novogranatense TaxID=1862640 RepID=A0AAV8TUA0_9ROSI|nr:hypothetical protein K2173_010116 [Erythroxylum novogranatense]